MATNPPGLNHIRAQDTLDQLRPLGQEQFEKPYQITARHPVGWPA